MFGAVKYVSSLFFDGHLIKQIKSQIDLQSAGARPQFKKRGVSEKPYE